MAIVAVTAATGGWAVVRRLHAPDPAVFETAHVDRGRIVAKVTASGSLSAIVTVQVGSQVSGTVAALYADFNATVKKGQLIAKIDPRLFGAAVEQARANLVAAEGNLAKAKAQAVDGERQAARNASLLAEKLVAQADYDTARSVADADTAAVEAAAGMVSQSKAQLHQAELNLAYTDITSPKDGTVISRSVDVGQTVAASLQAPTLFLIAEDLRKMQVDTSVAEADIGKLQPGMQATFTVDAYPGERFAGKVRQVRNAPQTVQNVVTYDAVIDVDNPDLKLKPGMTANCSFIYSENNDAIRVPNAALRFLPPPDVLARLNPDLKPRERGRGGSAPPAPGGPGRGGRPGGRGGDPTRKTVWLLKDGKPVPVVVHTGASDGSLTEVLSGELKEGDAVITDLTSGNATKPAQAAPSGTFPRRMF
jgi:HlyD family secretion protein